MLWQTYYFFSDILLLLSIIIYCLSTAVYNIVWLIGQKTIVDNECEQTVFGRL